ncbi:hypothetical protein ACE3NQ_16400 [Paenibacillus terreus]|uniref:Uncharacterized protein n=1 Tax=Paenibacillus terreus TaxID=1387834 RepID=A0ABV5BCE6_9BACL
MKDHNEHKGYLERLNKIQSVVERMLIQMKKNEAGDMEDRTEELADKFIDFTIENELRLQSIYKQLSELKKEVEVLANPTDNLGEARKKPGPKPKGVKRHYTLTMPQEDWDIIDGMIQAGHFKYTSDYFRFLHRSFVKSQQK